MSHPGSAPTRAAGAGFIEPRVLMRIRNLELRARVAVEGFWSGLHRSPYHGFSVEFTEYRPYAAGDDPRYLDWRVLGRSDRYFIKKFEDETNLRCHLLVDLSRSMSFGTAGYTKLEYAATLAATLAFLLQPQGDAVGLVTFDEQVRDVVPARHRPGHLRRLLIALEQAAGGRATNLAAPLRRIVELVRKRGLIVLISDLLAPREPLERSLTPLAASGHEVIVFQVLDPAEQNLGLSQPAMFRDLESGQVQFIDPAAARAEYQRRLEAHGSAIRALCQRLGIGLHRLGTERPLETALFDFLRERQQRGKLPRHAAGRARHPGPAIASTV
ncbi:MAG TPA: DUF58 domain-containing protein [Candidatus Paceibacterota bacterium]|nr:DUF58 domain-containing protein [Verrucomicrobiota bacterium]HRZ45164.1 DUF58 domain-containing protein [Candidatus Paceibacterota bacterium]HRZ91510.1 DUF58 domain-containing protein [Candidatus Paceibacterota bacterium]